MVLYNFCLFVRIVIWNKLATHKMHDKIMYTEYYWHEMIEYGTTHKWLFTKIFILHFYFYLFYIFEKKFGVFIKNSTFLV
jgi:hypothetical protein